MYSRLSDFRINRGHVNVIMTNNKVEKRRNLVIFIKESQRKTKIADYLPKVRYVCIIYIINKLQFIVYFYWKIPEGNKNHRIFTYTKLTLCV